MVKLSNCSCIIQFDYGESIQFTLESISFSKGSYGTDITIHGYNPVVPVKKESPKFESFIVDDYFGDKVMFVFDGDETRCWLMDSSGVTSICGICNKNPKDKYNNDYAMLLSYQRAKEYQLFGAK